MKTTLLALNAKYIHSAYGLYLLKSYSKQKIKVTEFTINQNLDYILSRLYEDDSLVFGFSTYIWNIDEILYLSENLKKVKTDAIIFLGGPEVSFDSKDILEKYDFIDFIISGEGEKALNSVLNKDDLTTINNLTYRVEEKVFENKFIEDIDLDEIPFPYSKNNIDIFKNKIIYYESQRGCPFYCAYCLSSLEKNMRFLSKERLVSDLQFFLDEEVRQVKFVDRTFNAKKEHCLFIINYLIDYDNNISNFHFELAADLLDDEIIKKLNTARKGLFQLEIGVQSTNEKTLKLITRKTDLEKIKKNVQKIRKYNNIHIHLDLIAGLPNEDYLSFKKSFNEVFYMGGHNLQLGFLKLLRGSNLRLEADKHGIVYREKAPYEFLFTKDLNFSEYIELKQIEDCLEKYYNSGLLSNTIDYISKHLNAFDIFLNLSKKFLDIGDRKVSKLKLYEIFYSQFHTLESKDFSQNIFNNLFKYDLLINDKYAKMPSFIKGNSKRKANKSLIVHEKLSKIEKDLIDIKKMSHLEFFTIDLFDENYPEKEILILFDYLNRDIIQNKAKVYKLEWQE